MSRRVRGLALLSLVLACACGSADPPIHPSFLLVVLDTVRADAVSAYGHEQGTTATIDRLAAAGLRYERAYAQSAWTLPSHATLFTGLPPSRHGVTSLDPHARDELVTLAERLQEAGYETVGVSENPWIHDNSNMTQGFERFRWVGIEPATADGAPARIPLDRSLGFVDQWISDREAGRPYFLFVNIVDAHAPYLVREVNPYLPSGVSIARAQRVVDGLTTAVCEDRPADSEDMAIARGLYLGGVAAADRKLEDILQRLAAADLASDLITVVTSDHGELFGEHGLRDHYYSLHEELLRIPLIVHGLPDVAPAEISQVVALSDVVPSILTWSKLPIPESLPGLPLPLEEANPAPAPRVITALFRDPLAVPARPAHRSKHGLEQLVVKHARSATDTCPEDHPPRGDIRVASRAPFKLVQRPGRSTHLYRLDDEDLDHLAREPRAAAVLEAALGEDERTTPPRRPSTPVAPVAPDTIDALRALGYVPDER